MVGLEFEQSRDESIRCCTFGEKIAPAVGYRMREGRTVYGAVIMNSFRSSFSRKQDCGIFESTHINNKYISFWSGNCHRIWIRQDGGRKGLAACKLVCQNGKRDG